MNRITPFVKRMRANGGTIYTFSSAIEDIGLNINERNNVVKISHFALLDIPNIAESSTGSFNNTFNIRNIAGAWEYEQNNLSIKDGRVLIAESFQNYALNLESTLLNQNSYNPQLSNTVSERVFWKWLKETGSIRWADPSISGNGTRYWKEENSPEYNSVVKYFGPVSAGNVRMDSFGTYNETYVLVPTSHGQSQPYFKQIEDDNYKHGLIFGDGPENILGRETYINPHPDGLSYKAYYDFVDSSIAVSAYDTYFDNSTGSYSLGWWYSPEQIALSTLNNIYLTDTSAYLTNGIYNTKLRYDGANTINFKRSKVDCISLEFDLNSLKTIYGDSALTYDKIATEYAINDAFNFNTVLIYYTIYNATQDEILATNLLGVMFLDAPSGNSSEIGNNLQGILLPSLEKIQSGINGYGTSYSLRLNIKTDNMIDDTAATIVDYSTSDQLWGEEWQSAFQNLGIAVNILTQQNSTINYISGQYVTLQGNHTEILNKIIDLEYRVNDLGKDVKGTPGTIAMFSDGDDPLIESSIYMKNGKIGIFTNDPHYPVEIDASIKVNTVILDKSIRDVSGNILLGYGSPLQLGSNTNFREVEIYTGNNNAAISIDTSNNIIFDGSLYSSSFDFYKQYLDASTLGDGLTWDGSVLKTDASIIKIEQLGDGLIWDGSVVNSNPDLRYTHKLLNSFPLSFIRDTEKINAPYNSYDYPDISINKYKIADTTPKMVEQTCPIQNGGTLKKVFFIDNSIGWSVGSDASNNLILKTINGGASWVQQTPIISTTILNSIYFANPSNGWAVGNKDASVVILKTIDGGSNWSQQTSPSLTGTLNSVICIDSSIAWAVGYTGTNSIAIKTTNGGTSWSSMSLPFPFINLKSIFFINSNIGYSVGAAGGAAYTMKTIDGGTNWTYQTIGSGTLNSVFFLDNSIGWAAGTDSVNTLLLKTTDGSVWTQDVNVPMVAGTLTDVKFLDVSYGFISGYYSNSTAILSYNDDGVYWNQYTLSDPSGLINSIVLKNKFLGWAVGNDNNSQKNIFKFSLLKSITLNRTPPIETLEQNTDPLKKWMLGTSETNSAFIDSINFTNNTIYLKDVVSFPSTFSINDNLDFYCWNRNQKMLNLYFNQSGWGAFDATTDDKQCWLLYRQDPSTLIGWFRNGSPYNKLGSFSTTNNFQTKTLINSIVSGVGGLSMFDVGGQIQLFNVSKYEKDKYFSIISGKILGVSEFRSIIFDKDMNVLFVSQSKIPSYYVINGVNGFLRSLNVIYLNGQTKIIFIHQEGTSTSFGDNFKVYMGDFSLEECKFKNLKLIASSEKIPTLDSEVSYIAGEIDVLNTIYYQNELYILIFGTCLTYPNTLMAGNRLIGFMYNEGGKWIYDKNGPTILYPRGEVINGIDIRFNTHAGGNAFYIDASNNKILNCGTFSNDGVYHNYITEFTIN